MLPVGTFEDARPDQAAQERNLLRWASALFAVALFACLAGLLAA